MYHAMFSPHVLTQLMGQPHHFNFSDISFNNRQNRILSGHCYGHSPFDQQNCPFDVLQLMGVEMPPTRSRGYNHPQSARGGSAGWRERGNVHGLGSALMPPPAPLGYRPGNNSSIKRSYWNNKSMARPPRCLIRDTNATDTSYSSDSGFSSRSPTPIKHQMGDQGPSDESNEDANHTSPTTDNSKGVKRLHEVYSSQSQCSNGSSGEKNSHQFYQTSSHVQQQSSQNVQYYNRQANSSRCDSPATQSSQHQNSSNYQSKRRYHSGRHSPPPMHRPQRGRRVNGMLLSFPSGLGPFYTIPDRFLSRAHLIEVTKTPSQLLSGGEWDKLSQGIWNYFITNQQTEETYKKKMLLWKCLYIFIKTSFPRYGLFLVGSTMSGFGSDKSDVDMCLLVRHAEMDQRNEAVSHLEQMLKYLKRCEFVDQPELIQAKVPILKFRDAHQGLEVDLNCNNAVGIRNTHLLYCYSQMDWRVRPLVLIVKLWARKHNINDAKNMTISSYSLVLMVIHFLQCGVSPPVLPCLHGMYQEKFTPHSDILMIDIHEDMRPFNSENIQSLGELLLQFLQYYVDFDFSQYAISVRLAARVPIDDCRRARSYKNDPHQWKYLCIEEPFDLTNTARSVYDRDVFEKVKAVFLASFNNLKKTRDVSSIFNIEKQDFVNTTTTTTTITTTTTTTSTTTSTTTITTSSTTTTTTISTTSPGE